MTELKCPKCGQVFTDDESDYAALLQQVRTHEFNDELEKRLNDKLKDERTIAQQKFDSEMERLKAEQEKALLDKDSVIAELKRDAELAQERQRNALNAQKAELDKKQSDELAEKNAEIVRLNGELKTADTQKELAVEKANAASKEQISELNSRVKELEEKAKTREEFFALEKEKIETEFNGKLESQKNDYDAQLRRKDEDLEREKNYKLTLSTKMIGESLERHCENEFDRWRLAFKNAYFEKDNVISASGSKGDYIYREEMDGVELLSIMFEMKTRWTPLRQNIVTRTFSRS